MKKGDEGIKTRIKLVEEFNQAPSNMLFKGETVCAVLDCTNTLLDSYRFRGIGPVYIKMDGRTIRYRKSDVLNYIKEFESCA